MIDGLNEKQGEELPRMAGGLTPAGTDRYRLHSFDKFTYLLHLAPVLSDEDTSSEQRR